MPGFLDQLFSAAAPAAPASAAPATGAPGPAGTPAAPAPPADPVAAAVSQLDQFKTLWQTPVDAEGKPIQQPADPFSQPILKLDPKVVLEQVNKLDFTANIAPELTTKALSGDPAALAEIINAATRNAVSSVTLNSANLVNAALAQQAERFKQSLPQHIKSVQLSQTQSENPVLQHPAVQPMIESMKQAAFMKDPTANPADIQRSVESYVLGIAKALQDSSPDAVKQHQAAAAGQQDWMQWAQT